MLNVNLFMKMIFVNSGYILFVELKMVNYINGDGMIRCQRINEVIIQGNSYGAYFKQSGYNPKNIWSYTVGTNELKSCLMN